MAEDDADETEGSECHGDKGKAPQHAPSDGEEEEEEEKENERSVWKCVLVFGTHFAVHLAVAAFRKPAFIVLDRTRCLTTCACEITLESFHFRNHEFRALP